MTARRWWADGLSAALLLASTHKVAILTKRAVREGSSGWAQGGIAAVWDKDDSFAAHVDDTLVAGAGLGRLHALAARVVEILRGSALVDQLGRVQLEPDVDIFWCVARVPFGVVGRAQKRLDLERRVYGGRFGVLVGGLLWGHPLDALEASEVTAEVPLGPMMTVHIRGSPSRIKSRTSASMSLMFFKVRCWRYIGWFL
ncbi:MAG: FAD-binding protein [Aggregatilineales bacterium]